MAVTIGTVPTFEHVEADKAQVLKIIEEASEVFSAWETWQDSYRWSDYRGYGYAEAWHDMMDECADLLQATCNLLDALGVHDMGGRMEKCREKNEQRGWVYED